MKLTENIFRAVNIALVNELKIVYTAMGIDIFEVIDAAKTKPFGYMPFYPGPGLGGHCIPIDPFYLTWKAREYGISTRFIELAGEINTAMPRWIVERTRASARPTLRQGAERHPDPASWHRLQEERRRHAREPSAPDLAGCSRHGAVGRLSRSVLAGDPENTRACIPGRKRSVELTDAALARWMRLSSSPITTSRLRADPADFAPA